LPMRSQRSSIDGPALGLPSGLTTVSMASDGRELAALGCTNGGEGTMSCDIPSNKTELEPRRQGLKGDAGAGSLHEKDEDTETPELGQRRGGRDGGQRVTRRRTPRHDELKGELPPVIGPILG
jgi:hypothetical protein